MNEIITEIVRTSRSPQPQSWHVFEVHRQYELEAIGCQKPAQSLPFAAKKKTQKQPAEAGAMEKGCCISHSLIVS